MSVAVVLCLAALIVASVILLWPPDRVEVPDMVGKSRRDAEEMLTTRGLKMKTTSEFAGGVDDGVVIRQVPDADVIVDEGTRVELILASNATIPAVVGHLEDVAVAQVRKAGLVERLTITGARGPWGTVDNIHPGENVRVKKGSVVELWIIRLTESQLVNRQLTDARTLLSRRGVLTRVRYAGAGAIVDEQRGICKADGAAVNSVCLVVSFTPPRSGVAELGVRG